MMKDYFLLGMVTKPFGYKGELMLYLDTDEPEKYADTQAVFFNIDGEMVPYMIESMTYKGKNQVIAKFADVSAEEAAALVKENFYLPISMLPPLTGNNFYYHEVIGFTVVDKEKGEIGQCLGFIDTGKQPIMQIMWNDKEILLPVVDEFFKTVDRDNKVLHIAAPEGLIDLYLE